MCINLQKPFLLGGQSRNSQRGSLCCHNVFLIRGVLVPKDYGERTGGPQWIVPVVEHHDSLVDQKKYVSEKRRKLQVAMHVLGEDPGCWLCSGCAGRWRLSSNSHINHRVKLPSKGVQGKWLVLQKGKLKGWGWHWGWLSLIMVESARDSLQPRITSTFFFVVLLFCACGLAWSYQMLAEIFGLCRAVREKFNRVTILVVLFSQE